MNPTTREAPAVVTLGEALSLSPEEAVLLFRSLEPPSFDGMGGEFRGHIPNHMHDDWHALLADSGLGRWLGKGYLTQPHGAFAGHGYNSYLKDGTTERHMRFGWSVAPSTVDGRPALVMRYAPFDNWSGRRDLVDELRVLGPGLLLGLYHTKEPVERFTPRARGERSALEFFVLEGPVGPASAVEPQRAP